MRLLFLFFIFFSINKSVYSTEWSKVYSGLDSISAFINFSDKLLLFNTQGKISEVDLNDYSSTLINTQERWIFSAVKNKEDLYMSVLNPSGTMPSILKSKDSGKNWSEFINDFGGNLFFATSYEFFGKDTCIFVGSDLNQNSFITYTYDGGETSSYLSLNNTKILHTVAKVNNILFVGSGNGKVFKSLDFGKSWSEVDYFKQINNAAIRNIQFYENIGIASNQNGEVFKSEDNGETWRKVETGLSGNFAFFHTNIIDYKIFISGRNYIKGVGLLLFSKDLGENWEIIFENDIGFRGTFKHNNYLYCVSNNRNLWQTDFNLVSVEDDIENISNEFHSIIADNKLLNTNINLEKELVIDFSVTDILGNNIPLENFYVVSQSPFRIEINSNVCDGVYYLLINNGINKKIIKFLVL